MVSVLTATMTRLQLIPFEMKVFWPLIMKWSPSLTAVARMAARSEPVPGSVIATAVMISPDAQPGSHFIFCSSLPKL